MAHVVEKGIGFYGFCLICGQECQTSKHQTFRGVPGEQTCWDCKIWAMEEIDEPGSYVAKG